MLFFRVILYLSRDQIKGRAEGKLDVGGGVHLGLKAALDKLSRDCNDVSDISIKYYATDLPDQLPTTMEGLVSLIEDFPSQLKSINNSKGVPMQAPVATIKLPSGVPLTIVLFGKTGDGKSATGNSIIGSECFEDGPCAGSVTQFCKAAKRKDEREVTVIDTPGFMDTVPILYRIRNASGLFSKRRRDILRELAKVFVMSPDGLDAIIIAITYGGRLGSDDAEALIILTSFFGAEAQSYIILILTHGDQAARDAKKKKRSIKDHLKWYITSLPDWVQKFITEIGERRVLFDNSLDPDEKPDDCKKQVSKLLQSPINFTELTAASRVLLHEEIKNAMDESGLTKQAEDLRLKLEENRRQLEDKDKSDDEKRKFSERVAQLEEEQLEVGSQKGKASGREKRGTIYDACFRRRRIESLKVGDEVLVITSNGIQSDTVITFIHRQPEIVEEFLKIVTTKKKILLITADHLLFVEVMRQATAIPARDVKIGDTVYVKGSHGSEKDSVRSISTVYEKGAYAPVSLSGTILVNDVHTSCYFDVLSHEWSHRAMGIARALHYVSPSMVQRISAIGEKNGFPGGKAVFIGSMAEDWANVFSLEGETGEIIWKYKTAEPAFSSPSVSHGNNVVFFCSYDANCYVFNTENGHVLWVFEADSAFQSSPVVRKLDETLLVGSTEGNIYAVDSANEKLK
ncbi:putative protein PHLOEM PROTEIN 2-LIKE A3 [Stylophora pistillata]|uniref:AIG1-type G domain-containing protein n=1 Tax=Stylophora pistillata TaxID=50429 RepID=A0A2B4RT89_STYPI|nr:putative protein PHLOEM PROTEIN 2-LIKE A3 [Stylophora pistillata]